MLCLSAVLLALTATTAFAGETLESRIRAAATEACATEAVHQAAASRAVFHYGTISARCIDRISNSAMAKYQAAADARMKASTAAN